MCPLQEGLLCAGPLVSGSLLYAHKAKRNTLRRSPPPPEVLDHWGRGYAEVFPTIGNFGAGYPSGAPAFS